MQFLIYINHTQSHKYILRFKINNIYSLFIMSNVTSIFVLLNDKNVQSLVSSFLRPIIHLLITFDFM